MGRARVRKSGPGVELCHSVGCTTGETTELPHLENAKFEGFLPDLKTLGSEDLR